MSINDSILVKDPFEQGDVLPIKKLPNPYEQTVSTVAQAAIDKTGLDKAASQRRPVTPNQDAYDSGIVEGGPSDEFIALYDPLSTAAAENIVVSLEALGLSGKAKHSRSSSLTDLVMRTVMRHPSDETRTILFKIHSELSRLLSNACDNDLALLLKEVTAENRGAFKDICVMKKFLEASPNHMSSSRLTAGLETCLSAIAYRYVKRIKPLSQSKITSPMDKQIADTVGPYLLGEITGTYPEKSLDRSRPFEDQEPDVIEGCFKEELSDVSDAEDESSKPQPMQKLKMRKFFPDIPGKERKLTWVGSACEMNIPILQHVSGSAAMTLAVIQGLLKDHLDLTKEHSTLQNIAGALIIPTFHRNNFHTIAETVAGVHFYKEKAVQYLKDKEMSKADKKQLKAEKKANKGPKIDPATINPSDALTSGLEWLVAATHPDYRAHIETVANFIMNNGPQILNLDLNCFRLR